MPQAVRAESASAAFPPPWLRGTSRDVAVIVAGGTERIVKTVWNLRVSHRTVAARGRPSLLHRGHLGAERIPAVGDEPPRAARGDEAAQAEGHERPAPRRGGRAGCVRQVEDLSENDRREDRKSTRLN